mgnify:CR=1 FL=1
MLRQMLRLGGVAAASRKFARPAQSALAAAVGALGATVAAIEATQCQQMSEKPKLTMDKDAWSRAGVKLSEHPTHMMIYLHGSW